MALFLVIVLIIEQHYICAIEALQTVMAK